MDLLSELHSRMVRADADATRAAGMHSLTVHSQQIARRGAFQECIDLVIERIGVTPERDDPDAAAYRTVADAAIEALNPPDDDASEESIIVQCIEHATAFIVGLPCTCALRPDCSRDERYYDHEACDRCRVLGRWHDRRVER